MGFSAGGHLASTAGTLFDAPEGRTGAPLDSTSARPDFLILVYPVITLVGTAVHAGSRDSLLGPSPSQALLEHLSTELQVTPRTPPAFLVHGGTDQSVPAENSLLFYSALRRAGVPAELHIYREGPHGIGLGRAFGPMSDWPKRCEDWLAVRRLAVRHGSREVARQPAARNGGAVSSLRTATALSHDKPIKSDADGKIATDHDTRRRCRC